MDIEKAKKILKCCMNDDCTKCEYADVFDCVKEHNEAIETVLNELEKKDKVINEMAEQLVGLSIYDKDKQLVIFKNEEEVKEYFTNKVEREGK